MRFPSLRGPAQRDDEARLETGDRRVRAGTGHRAASGGRPRAGRRAVSGQAGFTLVEAMTAFLVVGLAALGFLQVFAYGAVQLEKLGQRRQALGLLDGEMEYWRARFQAAEEAAPVAPAEAEARRREVAVTADAGQAFAVDPEISPLHRQRGLAYQTVRVRVTYGRADVADTLYLESRHYVR